jgi:hypothetical protein
MRPCQVCGELTNALCNGCKRISYCGMQHQAQHWESHSRQCGIGVVFPQTIQNDSMMRLLKFYKYSVYEKSTTDEKKYNRVLNEIYKAADRICKKNIRKDFISRMKIQTDVVFTFSHKIPSKTRGPAVKRIDTFALIKYEDDGSAYIHLVCNQDVIIGGQIVKLQLGAIIHGIALHFLVERGITSVYLEAITTGLITYYTALGYELNELKCGTDVQSSFYDIVWDLLTQKTPEKTGPEGGWLMRMCNILDSRLYQNVNDIILSASNTLENLKSVEGFTRLYEIKPRDRSPVRKVAQ